MNGMMEHLELCGELTIVLANLVQRAAEMISEDEIDASELEALNSMLSEVATHEGFDTSLDSAMNLAGIMIERAAYAHGLDLRVF